MKRKALALLALMLMVGHLQADFLPMGHKSIPVSYILINLDEYPDYDFTLMEKGILAIRQNLANGKPFSVERGRPFGYEYFLQANQKQGGRFIRSSILHFLREQCMVSDRDPAEEAIVYYRVELFTHGIEIDKVEEKRFDRSGRTVPVVAYDADGNRVGYPAVAWFFAGAGLVATVIIVLLQIRRRKVAAMIE